MAQTFNRPPRSKRATVLSAQSEAVLRTIADPFEAVEAHVPTTHATSHDRSVLAGDDFEAFLLRQRARIRAA
jgi:hypothetical protein